LNPRFWINVIGKWAPWWFIFALQAPRRLHLLRGSSFVAPVPSALGVLFLSSLARLAWPRRKQARGPVLFPRGIAWGKPRQGVLDAEPDGLDLGSFWLRKRYGQERHSQAGVARESDTVGPSLGASARTGWPGCQCGVGDAVRVAGPKGPAPRAFGEVFSRLWPPRADPPAPVV
jgi:hypothetical protein